MFDIAVRDDKYRTYILTDTTHSASMEIVPDRGGIVTRWQVGDRQVLYFDADRFADPSKSVRGGIPILFPICGDLPDNTYTLDGQSYPLPRHGFARDLPWEVTQQDKDNGSLTLVLNSSDRTRQAYPFDFQLQFTYQLRQNSLEIRQAVTNQSQKPMPFSLGLHPYFPVADKSKLQIDIPGNEYLDQTNGTMHPFAGDFDFNRDEIDVAFANIDRNSASATDGETQLLLEYDNPYSVLVFWTVKGQDYYCLEPWSALRNALNTGDRLVQLPPGETFETWVRLTT